MIIIGRCGHAFYVRTTSEPDPPLCPYCAALLEEVRDALQKPKRDGSDR